jgi:hypothetical protein
MRDSARCFASKPPAARIVLPVSGIAIRLRRMTGDEDIMLAEGRPEDPALALALVERLARSKETVDWATLSVADIDTLIVRLRQVTLGDRIVADVVCSGSDCRCRVDLSFGLAAYLSHHRPKRPRGRLWSSEVLSGDPCWFVLTGKNSAGKDLGRIEFRLPGIGDVIDATDEADPVASLAASCLRPAAAPARLRSMAESAMAALAPPLAGPIEGRCPQCGAVIAAQFDARTYCLSELCERARFIYDDIDALAERYHWSEQEILTLPNDRRNLYAERARQARSL